MKVFVVVSGGVDEEGEIDGIFFTRKKAEECVQNTIKVFTNFAPSHYHWEQDQNEWWSGRNYLRIEEHEVK